MDRGVVTAFAFGGAKSIRRFCGCLDTFNELDCRISFSRGREFVVLEEASLDWAPRRLRTDWRRMGMAVNCLSFTEAVALTPEGAPECFAQVEELHKVLEADEEPSAFLPQFFRLRLCAALGMAPNLEACSCGATVSPGAYFLSEEGRVFCARCMQNLASEKKRRGLWLSRDALDLARVGLLQNISQMRLNVANTETLRQCGRAINDFVEYQMGLVWENGRFRRL